MDEERIAKIMARRGLCSRREAERLIDAGQVVVDGVVVSGQGQKAPLDAAIVIAPAGAAALDTKLTVVLNKPAGIVSTQPEPNQTPAWRLLRAANAQGETDAEIVRRVAAAPQSFSVAGRLDRASRGLLVMTQDGTVARRIIGAHDVRKLYVVQLAEPVSAAQVHKLSGRMSLEGELLLPMTVERLGPDVLRFGLVEGRKHQIRRVCRKVGLDVVDLFREAVGPIHIGDLPEGSWRVVSAAELAGLNKTD